MAGQMGSEGPLYLLCKVGKRKQRFVLILYCLSSVQMAQRQSLKAAAETSDKEVDVEAPVKQYTEKALYLLKFGGLQRVHIKSEVPTY